MDKIYCLWKNTTNYEEYYSIQTRQIILLIINKIYCLSKNSINNGDTTQFGQYRQSYPLWIKYTLYKKNITNYEQYYLI